MSEINKRLSLIAVLVGVASAILIWPSHRLLLGWDEVDYVNAAKLGIKANMLEQFSLSPVAYWEFSRAKLARRPPQLPPSYDEGRDTLLLRHYHPPLVVFLMSLLPDLNSERVARSVQLLGAFLLSLAIFFCYGSLTVKPTWPGLAILSSLTIWINLNFFRAISFHGWAAIWVTTTAAALILWLNSRARSWGWVLCASLALSFLTLETGVFIIGIVFLYLVFRYRLYIFKCHRAWWKEIIVGACMIGLGVLIFWPGAILKASLVKIPALYAYRIVQGQEYANVPGMWKQILMALLPMSLVFPAVVWIFFKDRARMWYLAPLVVLGGLYAIILARFAISPGYLLPGFAPLICLVGIMTDQISSKIGRIGLLAATFYLIGASGVRHLVSAEDQSAREDLNWLAKVMMNREALVDGGHIYQYYLGPNYQIRTISLSYDAHSLFVRERGEYRSLRQDELVGRLVVAQKRPEQVIGGEAAQLLGNCLKFDRNHITVWDCAVKE